MSEQRTLFDSAQRAASQLAGLKRLMLPSQAGRPGPWMTLVAIRDALALRDIHASEAGISARLRDLRKVEHGAHQVDRKLDGPHRYVYRVWGRP